MIVSWGPLLAIVGSLLAVVVALAVFSWRVRLSIAAARMRLGAMLHGKPTLRIDERAQFLGLASIGPMQLRGLAVLALAEGELVSLQILVDRTVQIPTADIVSVGDVKSWLGKWIAQRLLHVVWRTPSGEESAAWRVRDLEGWKAAIEAARPRGLDRQARA